VEWKGDCAEQNLCRAGSVAATAAAGIACSHQCLPSLAARRLPSAVHPHLRLEPRFRYGGYACCRNPCAPFTAPRYAVDSSEIRILSTRVTFPGKSVDHSLVRKSDLSIEKSNLFFFFMRFLCVERLRDDME